MILNEKFNPYMKAIRIFFSENWGTFLFSKKKRRDFSWLLSGLYCRTCKFSKGYANKGKGSGH